MNGSHCLSEDKLVVLDTRQFWLLARVQGVTLPLRTADTSQHSWFWNGFTHYSTIAQHERRSTFSFGSKFSPVVVACVGLLERMSKGREEFIKVEI